MNRFMIDNFNTSHVYINPLPTASLIAKNFDFNTSHVYINLAAPPNNPSSAVYFNTSHVYINPQQAVTPLQTSSFQYISCLY